MEENQINIKHIGIIADGNRRWARERGLPTLEGHRKGLDSLEMLVEEFANRKIPFVSFFIFSTENWNRSPEEVSYLMKLLGDRIGSLAKKMKKQNVKLLILGSRERVSDKLLQKLDDAVELTKDCTGTTACFCFNYGGEQELVDAMKAIQEEGCEITAENIRSHLYHPEVPNCDLVVRTSGEQRISGYMLYRAAYSEFLFVDKYFPALEPADVDYMLEEFEKRERRFGK